MTTTTTKKKKMVDININSINIKSEMVKKLVDQVKDAQKKFHTALKTGTLFEDARKYAEAQGVEVKKLLTTDVKKIKTFLEKERQELDRFQRKIPGEIRKISRYIRTQKKELDSLLKVIKTKNRTASTGTKTRKTSAKKSSSHSKTASTQA